MHTALSIATAAKAAYLAGTLTLQVMGKTGMPDYLNVTPEGVQCNCAIGAALSPSELCAVIMAQGGSYFAVNELPQNGGMPQFEPRDMSKLREIQRLHDVWCNPFNDALTTDEAETRFVARLDRIIAQ